MWEHSISLANSKEKVIALQQIQLTCYYKHLISECFISLSDKMERLHSRHESTKLITSYQ
jgi:hypothetical protein